MAQSRIEDDIEEGGVIVDLTEKPKTEAKAAKSEGGKAEDGDTAVERPSLSAEELQKKLADLEGKRAKDREARLAAERKAAEAETKAAKAETELASSELDTLANAAEAAKARVEAVERELTDALEAGDAKKVVSSQKALANATYDLRAIEDGKKQRELEIKQKADAPKSETKAGADPVEAMIDRVPSLRSREYLREHKDWVSDPKSYSKMLAGHHMALSEGCAADSDDYFAFIDAHMEPKARGERREQQDNGGERAARFVPAAPVSRAGADVAGGNRVYLTPAQKEIAEAQGYSLAEYAKIVQKASKIRGNEPGIIRFSRDQAN